VYGLFYNVSVTVQGSRGASVKNKVCGNVETRECKACGGRCTSVARQECIILPPHGFSLDVVYHLNTGGRDPFGSVGGKTTA
jgi:hypothetical protein